jgi:hypothetical protein
MTQQTLIISWETNGSDEAPPSLVNLLNSRSRDYWTWRETGNAGLRRAGVRLDFRFAVYGTAGNFLIIDLQNLKRSGDVRNLDFKF